MEFFNNKRLLVILSGIACILIALVIFVVSLIGLGNIGALFGGKPSVAGTADNENTTKVPVRTVSPTQTPDYSFTQDPYETTVPPVTETPTATIPATDVPTETATQEPTPTPTATPVPVSDVTIQEGSSLITTVGKEVQLHAIVKPDNATNQKITWSSSDNTVAMVDGSTGLVVTRAAGKVHITARSADGEFDQITIYVVSVSVDSSNAGSLEVGDTAKVAYTIAPKSDELNVGTATWKSSDENVATVAADGTVTAVGAGEATITVKVTVATEDGSESFTESTRVVVTAKEEPVVTGVMIQGENKINLTLGTTPQPTLRYTVTPAEATITEVVWTSNNEEVVSVAEDGKLTLKKGGSATISVTVNGVKSKGVTVTVMDGLTSGEPQPGEPQQ